MGMKLGIAVLAAAAALASGSALAEEGAYEGTWKLNVEQSHYPAMMPTIKDHVMVVSYDDGKLLKYTDNFTIADKTTHVTFDGAYDGKPYKMTNGQDMHVQHTKGGYIDHWKDPSGSTGIDACDFSGNMTVMTCHSSFTPKGAKKPVPFVEVWNKVQ
jgi:hypothetical protein